MRVLRLLEDHHRKLAEVIRSKDQVAKRLAEKGQKAEDIEKEAESISIDIQTAQKEVVVSREKPSTPSLFRADPRRESSPALAKDMASRRGIPPTQQRRTPGVAPSVSTAQATGRMSAVPIQHSAADSRFTDQTAKPNVSPRVREGESKMVTTDDDGFSRFYSNLTSGPLSKLSSMLAFAGLPLAEQSPEESPTQSKTEKTSTRAITGPDVNQLFSKAAMRALEEQQRKQGFSGNTFGPGESFYVIPTSGGTASYANILSQQQGHKRGKSTNEADEFVDAKEHLPRTTRGSAADLSAPSSIREEELQMENSALKQILDKLSHRLQAFESHAQDASMAALTQSMASVRSQPHSHGQNPQTSGITPEMEERMRAMEAQLEREMKERERLGLENQKQKAVISKYRSHWEQLKTSAKARRDRSDGGSDAASTPAT